MRHWPAVALMVVATIAVAQEPKVNTQEPTLKDRQATQPRVPESEVQTEQDAPATDVAPVPARPRRVRQIVVPAGTKVPVALRSAVSTKTAHVGDNVYAQTTFPVAVDNHMVIPAGTYVQGRVMKVVRPGRIKGRAEIMFHFTSLVFPSGYTVSLPGAVDNSDSTAGHVKDKEGTIQHEGEKGKDAKTIGTTAAEGAAIGGLASGGLKGVGVGGGLGAATGTAIALLSRGSDMRLEAGSTVEMVLQRDLILDETRVRGAAFRY